MASITSTNAVIILTIDDLLLSQQMQGFSADDIFDVENIDIAEEYMGLDGKLSAGFVPVPISWSVTLQADSPSMAFFEAWYNAEQQAMEKYFVQGGVTLSSVGSHYALVNGILKNYSPMPVAKKALQPRKFTIKWESVQGAPQ